MRPTTPRMLPLPVSEIPEEVLKYSGAAPGKPVLNIYATVARHPKLAKRWLLFGAHVLGKSTLPPRERELVILRTGWRCQSEYEWGQHTRVGKQAGLTADEIKRIAKGPEAPGWSALDATLLRATDELHDDCCISDATWQALSASYGEQQLLDLIFAIGQYRLVCMALNSLGVQREPGTPGFAETL